MNTDNRTNEQIVAEELAYVTDECSCHRSTAEYLARDAVAALTEAGRLAGEPTEAMVLAAAKAIEKIPHIVWNSPTRQDAMTLARAALVAAQGAAPQAATAHGPVHFECDCVPNLGPPHCHACSDEIGNPVMWSACPNAVPVQPSITVDEIAEVIRLAIEDDESRERWGAPIGAPKHVVIARAVVEAIGGDSRG